MKAYKKLVKYALDSGIVVSVWDGEAWEVKRSSNYKDIVSAIESVDEAELRFRTADDGLSVGWALVTCDINMDDDETVIDHTDNEWINNALS